MSVETEETAIFSKLSTAYHNCQQLNSQTKKSRRIAVNGQSRTLHSSNTTLVTDNAFYLFYCSRAAMEIGREKMSLAAPSHLFCKRDIFYVYSKRRQIVFCLSGTSLMYRRSDRENLLSQHPTLISKTYINDHSVTSIEECCSAQITSNRFNAFI